jgi:hypothetical protein
VSDCIPADRWSPDNRGAEIKKLADALTQRGEIVWLRVESLNPAGVGNSPKRAFVKSHNELISTIHFVRFSKWPHSGQR